MYTAHSMKGELKRYVAQNFGPLTVALKKWAIELKEAGCRSGVANLFNKRAHSRSLMLATGNILIWGISKQKDDAMTYIKRMLLGVITVTSLWTVASLSHPPAGAAATTQPKIQTPFLLDGKLIHPLLLVPLLDDLAGERPVVVAVDVEASLQSGSLQGKVKKKDGTVSADDPNGGSMAYRYIGTTPGGVHVLVTMINWGGSGFFESAIWVKLVHDQVSEEGKKRDRTTLVKVGSFTLGDRDDGEVKLDGSTLHIGKSKYREQATTLSLE
jgi:hypothetical protein